MGVFDRAGKALDLKKAGNNEDENNSAAKDQEVKKEETHNAEEKLSFKEFWESTKASNKRMEDTHRRATFLIDKSLLEELDKLSEGKKGYKTHFLNFVLAEAIKEEKEQQNK